MYGYIYKTTNSVNGKIYVGQHRGKVNLMYLGSGPRIRKAVEEYGEDKFSVQVLQYADTKEQLDLLEIYYIDVLDSRNPDIGYNIHKGGTGGDTTINWSEQRREQYRKLQHDMTMSGKTPLLKYCSHPGSDNGMFGRVRSKEEKQRISMARKGKGCGFTHNRGRVAINNGVKTLKVLSHELNAYLESGWVLGFAGNVTKRCLGKKWIADGNTQMLVDIANIKKFLDNGFVFGRLHRHE